MADTSLRPFNFNQDDLNFLLTQIEFRALFTKDATGNLVALLNAWDGTTAIYDNNGTPLFDPAKSYAPADIRIMAQKAFAGFGQLYDAAGKAIIGWDGSSAIYDAHGVQIWNGAAALTTAGLLSAQEAVAIFGTSYDIVKTGSAVTDFAGLRNFSGQFNNLNPGQANWGATDGLFAHDAPVHQGDYLQQATAAPDVHSLESLSTTTVNGPTTTQVVAVPGHGNLTIGWFDQTTTVSDAITTVTDGHHLLASSNQVDTTDTVSITPMDAFTKTATGPAATTVNTTSTIFLSGGELDPKYHPQFTATATDPNAPTFDPAHYVPNLSDRANIANNTDYAITFDPVTKAKTEHSVIDYTPRMITQTTTQGGTPVQYLKVADPTAITHDPLDATSAGGFAYHYAGGTGVVLLRDGLNHIVYWNSKAYDPGLVAYFEDQLANGKLAISDLRDPTNTGKTLGLDGGGHVWNPDAYNYSKPIYDSKIDTSALIEGTSIINTSVALLPGQADGTGGSTSQGDANLYSGAGYGTLSMTGQHDKQNTDENSATGHGNHEYFYGNIASIAGNAPNNGWFALFGQFFDHGLDFINKSGSYQIVVPLAVDDPLYGVIGQDGKPTTSITINRAVVAGPVQPKDPLTGQPKVDAAGNPVYIPGYQNHDSPYIDQSQTYGSQVDVDNILRNWVKDPNSGAWIMGDTLVDGHTVKAYTDAFGNSTTASLPTLNELRAEIRAHGGRDVGGTRADLTWEDVSHGLRPRDAGGAIVTVAAAVEPLLLDMNPHFDQTHIGLAAAAVNSAFSGTGLAPLAFNTDGSLTGGLNALAPYINFADFSIQPSTFGAPAGSPVGPGVNAVAFTDAQHAALSELMMQSVGDHYVAGDGRANENVGLTAIHHVFHMEHGYQVQNIETYILGLDKQHLAGADAAHPHATAHDWQVAVAAKLGDVPVSYVAQVDGHYEAAAGSVVARDKDGNFYVTSADQATAAADVNHAFASYVTNSAGAVVTADGSYTDALGSISWDQNKMFNAAKVTVEMEYQHIAVDQYSRAVSPNIQEFAGYTSDKNADISLEFGQAAFRFGHSTLRETIDTMDPSGGITGKIMSYALEKAFLNPTLFAQVGPGSIALGMERQLMNEVDNYITPSMNEGLLGQPMDLGAINIARGRDVGMPTLNEMKTALGMKAYADWADFGAQMVHPESLVNFIAAYSFDGDMTKAQTIVDLASGAALSTLPLDEQTFAGTLGLTYTDQFNYATHFMNGGDKGIDKVDLWIGGLAELHVAGGVLGETFDTIFVTQIEKLMDGDRFYYLQRLVNQQFGDEIQNEQFKDLVERTTGITHLNGNIFAYADHYYEENKAAKVATADLNDPTKLGDLYAGSKHDGTWHQVFKVDAADGKSGHWVDATGAFTGTAPPVKLTGAIYDLWGQEVVDLFDDQGNKVFDRKTMTWSAGFDPTLSAAIADKTLFYDKNTDMATGLSPGAAAAGFFLISLGADQHKYGQVVDAHATDPNHYAGSGLNGAGTTVLDDTGNVGVGIWSVGGATTQGNGQIHEHQFLLPLSDGVYYTPSPLATPLGSIGGIDPGVIPGDHLKIDNNYILDVRPDGTTLNKDGSLDTGASSAEVLVGTKFNDYIEMGIGDDTAYGGAGNDVIFGGKSNAGHNTIYGGDGNDFLFGGDAPDLIDGGNGDDWIWGNSSGSSVNGVDQLIGGNGNDHIFGGIGIDKMFGGNGDDYLYGGQDTDPFMFGGDGNDYMNGGSGQDTLFGGNGDDILDGGPGIDLLYGGNGDDILRPGDGVSDISGNGGGGDVLIGGDGVTDTGFDFADYSQQTAATGLHGDLANQAAVGTLPKDVTPTNTGHRPTTVGTVWSGLEGIIGTPSNDHLFGDSAGDIDAAVSHGNNWLIGGSGNDFIMGRGGDDIIIGGSIRLDSLIGTYGSASHPTDAYHLANDYSTNAEGASHRIWDDATLQANSLLDFASGITYHDAHNVAYTVTYEKHLTELLKSRAYKDYVLGDGGKDGNLNVAAYTGKQSDYTVTFLPFTDAHGTVLPAVQIHDNRAGSPDGNDILVGIQQLDFNYNETTGTGTLVDIATLLDAAPNFLSKPITAAFKENTAAAVNPAQSGLTTPGTAVGSLTAQHVLTPGQVALGAINPGSLTWSIVNTDAITAGLFALTAATTTVSGATATDTASLAFAKAPDFEALKAAGATVNPQGQIALTVHVQVSDGMQTAVQDQTVLIDNVDELSTGAIHFAGAAVSGNTVRFTGSPGTLADPDVTGTPALTYGLSGTDAPTSGTAFTGANTVAGGIHQFHLTGTYTQPFPLPTATTTSPESAFVGTGGNDTIAGTAGADIMVGLNGNDTYIVNNVGDVVIEGANGGTDTVLSYLNAYTLPNNVENLTFAGTGDFVGTGNSLANTIMGGAGNDRFIATVDNARDTYIGGGGSDTVDFSAYATGLTVDFRTGTGGGPVTVVGSGMPAIGNTASTNDVLYGIQNFIGGSGNDTVFAAKDNIANHFDGGGGNNTANYSAYNNPTVSLTVDFTQTVTTVVNSGADTAHSDTLTNFQNFVGGSGNDTVIASNDTAGLHSYDGGLGSDTIDFSHLTANLNVDLRFQSLVGGTQTTIRNFENVVGGAGNDTVTVGTATTHFTGGAGADTMKFVSLDQIKNGASRDVFTDFSGGIDKIDLHLVDANGFLNGTPHFTFNEATAFWDGTGGAEFAKGTGTGAASTAAQIRYHDETVGAAKHTILDLHTTNNAGPADHQIDLGVDTHYAARTATTAEQHQIIHAGDIII